MRPGIEELRSERPALRIPMWVYEYDGSGGVADGFPRYESPCGFMRLSNYSKKSFTFLLRIPMWVYESLTGKVDVLADQVTNPHVGL